MNRYDIIVAGGGFAGAAAAISAARLGKNVLLLEKSNALGGAACNCLVNPFMPFHTKIDGERKRLSAGLFEEIQNRLQDVRNELGELRFSNSDSFFGEEHLKLLLNRMAAEAGVHLLYHATLCGVKKNGGKLESVTVATKSGNIEFCADYFIDATGDANLSYMAGAKMRLGRDGDSLCQPMTLCFRVGNVDVDWFYADRDKVQEVYSRYQAEGKIRNPRENVLVFRTIQTGVLHFNSTRIVKKNPVDPFDVTQAEIEAREQVIELFTLLKQNIPAMKNAELLSTATEIGVRESRMIDGEHILTGKEIIGCCRFEDSIACGNYDVDIHNPEGAGTSHYYFPDGQYYQIPYRSLIPLGFENLLVAGRCISVDHEAQASIRIMPIVCCLGEAAGVAAAVASEEKGAVKNADIKRIRDILHQNGACID